MSAYCYLATSHTTTNSIETGIIVNMIASHGILSATNAHEARQMTAEIFYNAHSKYPTGINLTLQTSTYINSIAEQST